MVFCVSILEVGIWPACFADCILGFCLFSRLISRLGGLRCGLGCWLCSGLYDIVFSRIFY